MLLFALRNTVILSLWDWSGACLDALAYALRLPRALRGGAPLPWE